MAIFMAKTRPRWLGCSRLDWLTWKVSYHTPIHGRAWLGASMVGFWWGEDPTWKSFYVPYHISLYGWTCILAILDLSMHIYLLLSAEDPAWKLFYVLCDLWGPHLEIVYILFSMWKHLAKAIFSDTTIYVDFYWFYRCAWSTCCSNILCAQDREGNWEWTQWKSELFKSQCLLMLTSFPTFPIGAILWFGCSLNQ